MLVHRHHVTDINLSDDSRLEREDDASGVLNVSIATVHEVAGLFVARLAIRATTESRVMPTCAPRAVVRCEERSTPR